MTSQSYQNYISNLQCCYAALGDKVADELRIDSCSTDATVMQFNIFTAMFNILKCYKLQSEQESIDDPQNCLTPEQMKCISQFLNKLCGTLYCVDFILTSTSVLTNYCLITFIDSTGSLIGYTRVPIGTDISTFDFNGSVLYSDINLTTIISSQIPISYTMLDCNGISTRLTNNNISSNQNGIISITIRQIGRI